MATSLPTASPAVRKPFYNVTNSDRSTSNIIGLTTPITSPRRQQYTWSPSSYSSLSMTPGAGALELELVGPEIDVGRRLTRNGKNDEQHWDTTPFGALRLDLGVTCPPLPVLSPLKGEPARHEPLPHCETKYDIYTHTLSSGRRYDRAACRLLDLPALEEGGSN